MGLAAKVGIVAAVVAALYLAREVLMPLALAGLVSFALVPVVTWLERLRLGRFASVGIVVGACTALVTGGGWVVVAQMADVVAELPKHRSSIQQKFDTLASGLEEIERVQDALVPVDSRPSSSRSDAGARGTQRPVSVSVVDNGPSFLKQLPGAVRSLLDPAGVAGMVGLFAIFMLVCREDLRNRTLRLASNMTTATKVLTEASDRVGRYLRMQTLLSVIYGVVAGLGLLAFGIPGWALWGFLCAALRFLPYVGPWIGAAMPTAMAFATTPGWELALGVAAFFVVIELITNLVLEPWLYGDSSGISPFAVVITAAAWTWIWGPAGLLLATPLSVLLVVLGEHVPGWKFLVVMLGKAEPLSPQERYYQRIIAKDPDEALKVIQQAAATRPLPAVCETVVIPALSALERDRGAGRVEGESYAEACECIRDTIEEVLAADPAAEQDVRATTGATLPAVNCLPVHPGADEVAASIASCLLRKEGFASPALSNDLTIPERIDQVERGATVCLVMLPDPTLRHGRAMCKRLASRRPDLKVLVLVWEEAADLTSWRHRSLARYAVEVTTGIEGLSAAARHLSSDPPADSPPRAKSRSRA